MTHSIKIFANSGSKCLFYLQYWVYTSVLITFSTLIDPDLIYDKCVQGTDGFEGTLDILPQGHTINRVRPELSGISSDYSTI